MSNRDGGGSPPRSRKASPMLRGMFGGKSRGQDGSNPSSFTEQQQGPSSGSRQESPDPRTAATGISPGKFLKSLFKSKPSGAASAPTQYPTNQSGNNHQQQQPQQQQPPQQQQQQRNQQQPQQQQQYQQNQSNAVGTGGTQDVRELQHRVQVLSAQQQDYDDLKNKLKTEQRRTNEWREKWNHQVSWEMQGQGLICRKTSRQ